MVTRQRFWLGTPPSTCDTGKEPITDEFIDGKTVMGPWANMCPACFEKYGIGLGTGRGQRYVKQSDGQWLKVDG